LSIPFDKVIWNAQDCADYFKESRQEFLRTRRHKQGFPPELENCPLRWSAVAVTEWALRGGLPAANSPGFTQRAA
jgi:hypothetical protein